MTSTVDVAHSLTPLRRAAWCVVGGYGIALIYRVGLLQKLLPRRISTAVDNVVSRVKARTEPLGNTQRYAAARKHLLRVYTLSTMGMLFAAVGGAAFCVFPKIPIVIPVALTVVPSTLVLLLPRDMMIEAGRVACLFTSALALGYSFGPIGWVAWDSLAIFTTLLASTMTGLCLPLFLTRGMISYVLSSQLLSCALSLAAVTTAPLLIPHTNNNNNINNLTSGIQPGVNGMDILRRTDVNVLLTMQLISNWGINLLHTLPTIVHFVRWKESEEQLPLSVDPVKESLCICGGVAYVFWRSFRWVCRRIIRPRNESTDVGMMKPQELSRDPWGYLNHNVLRRQTTGGVGASLLLLLWYVRSVSALQRGETVATLESLRSVCARISPVNLLVARM
ncbi:putative retrotransposon hot spot (RHS) protein [Trypanosoma theileri]|uniref:Putative retrotransposon hot spot (RHS) protein n=1 Tax=Trypanosoma theileri TaxID=67003 RepID=A0A1X0P431_9TRYP|nr:putative retrotransposon hot spot (RHS) protein [Trypanosoma theileri]ORC91591.1 putative retrotransposon hot spot (RHS) protein [Trypanosoma theileri]